jgi:hypothetical protein
VTKASHSAIAGADVQLVPGSRRVVTDDSGRFSFERVDPGDIGLLVRRLGFMADSMFTRVAANEDLDVVLQLEVAAQSLDTVTVAGREHILLARGKLAGFYQRKQIGIGRFLEAADMEKLLSRRLSDVLLTSVPGIRIMRSRRSGSAAYVFATRLGSGCYPDVYLDGVVVFSSNNQVLGGLGAEAGLFDVNSVDPGHVAGIEYYGGPSQLPAQYNRTGSACGALLIWTK